MLALDVDIGPSSHQSNINWVINFCHVICLLCERQILQGCDWIISSTDALIYEFAVLHDKVTNVLITWYTDPDIVYVHAAFLVEMTLIPVTPTCRSSASFKNWGQNSHFFQFEYSTTMIIYGKKWPPKQPWM